MSYIYIYYCGNCEKIYKVVKSFMEKVEYELDGENYLVKQRVRRVVLCKCSF